MNRRDLLFALILGAAGGAALIGIVRATTRGPVIFVAYAVMCVVAVVYLRGTLDSTFFRRLCCAFAAFAIATTITFVYVVTVAAPGALKEPWWKNAVALAFALAIGLPVCALVAAVSKRVSPSTRVSAS